LIVREKGSVIENDLIQEGKICFDKFESMVIPKNNSASQSLDADSDVYLDSFQEMLISKQMQSLNDDTVFNFGSILREYSLRRESSLKYPDMKKIKKHERIEVFASDDEFLNHKGKAVELKPNIRKNVRSILGLESENTMREAMGNAFDRRKCIEKREFNIDNISEVYNEIINVINKVDREKKLDDHFYRDISCFINMIADLQYHLSFCNNNLRLDRLFNDYSPNIPINYGLRIVQMSRDLIASDINFMLDYLIIKVMKKRLSFFVSLKNMPCKERIFILKILLRLLRYDRFYETHFNPSRVFSSNSNDNDYLDEFFCRDKLIYYLLQSALDDEICLEREAVIYQSSAANRFNVLNIESSWNEQQAKN
jgi:hypothetical protein